MMSNGTRRPAAARRTCAPAASGARTWSASTSWSPSKRQTMKHGNVPIATRDAAQWYAEAAAVIQLQLELHCALIATRASCVDDEQQYLLSCRRPQLLELLCDWAEHGHAVYRRAHVQRMNGRLHLVCDRCVPGGDRRRPMIRPLASQTVCGNLSASSQSRHTRKCIRHARTITANVVAPNPGQCSRSGGVVFMRRHFAVDGPSQP